MLGPGRFSTESTRATTPTHLLGYLSVEQHVVRRAPTGHHMCSTSPHRAVPDLTASTRTAYADQRVFPPRAVDPCAHHSDVESRLHRPADSPMCVHRPDREAREAVQSS